MDAEFDNEFISLTSVSHIQEKALAVIFNSPAMPSPALPNGSVPPPSSPVSTSHSSDDCSSCTSFDIHILSSSPPPPDLLFGPLSSRFPHFLMMKENGILLNPHTKLKSSILDGLTEAVIQYKVYVSNNGLCMHQTKWVTYGICICMTELPHKIWVFVWLSFFLLLFRGVQNSKESQQSICSQSFSPSWMLTLKSWRRHMRRKGGIKGSRAFSYHD